MRLRPRSSRSYFLLAAAMAVVAGLMAHSYLGRTSAAAGSGPQAPVVVAAEHIERGQAIGPSQVHVVRMPRRYAPPGSLSKIEQLAGRVALADLSPGEPVTETRLARVRAGPVASLVPEGLRAFAVPTSLPPGAVAQGDRVDILATYSSGQPHTEGVVDGVEVLLVLGPPGQGGASSRGIGLDIAGAGAGEAVTLIVLISPDQESRLAFARAFGDLEVAIAPAAA